MLKRILPIGQGWFNVGLFVLSSACLHAVLGSVPAKADGAAPTFVKHELAQKTIGLLDYIAADYYEAVPAEGERVLNEFEYAEMIRFAAEAQENLTPLHIQSGDILADVIKQLGKAIEQKARPPVVQSLAVQGRNILIGLFAVPTHPTKLPDLERGRKLFEIACAPCHGLDGKAETAAGRRLDPRPRVFNDPVFLERLSPFRAFNTVTFGVANTGMSSFSILTEQDRWDVVSYLFTFRPSLPPPNLELEPYIPWQLAMRLSDGELIAKLRELPGASSHDVLRYLSQTRNLRYLSDLTSRSNRSNIVQRPEGRLSPTASINLAMIKIQAAFTRSQINDREAAETLAESARFDDFKHVAPALRTLGQSDVIRLGNSRLISFSRAVRSGAADLESIRKATIDTLAQVRETIQTSHRISRPKAFFSAVLYSTSAGLGALLLWLLTLLAIGKTPGFQSTRWGLPPVWISAVAIGVAADLLFGPDLLESTVLRIHSGAALAAGLSLAIAVLTRTRRQGKGTGRIEWATQLLLIVSFGMTLFWAAALTEWFHLMDLQFFGRRAWLISGLTLPPIVAGVAMSFGLRKWATQIGNRIGPKLVWATALIFALVLIGHSLRLALDTGFPRPPVEVYVGLGTVQPKP